MINRVVLVGRMTKDPVLRKTASGASVVSFTIACDRRVKTEGQPTADFINTVAWNKTADIVAQYTHKGSLVGVEGRIQTRSYDDQSGKRVYITEVVADSVQFLESKNASAGNANAYVPEDTFNQSQGYQSDDSASQSYSSDFASSDTLDIASDDLPF
ncbi:single-stranded DNA-binding protein [Amedibacillus sp. YH-ame10]